MQLHSIASVFYVVNNHIEDNPVMLEMMKDETVGKLLWSCARMGWNYSPIFELVDEVGTLVLYYSHFINKLMYVCSIAS